VTIITAARNREKNRFILGKRLMLMRPPFSF
jgi:hypothetical protein